MLIFCVSRKVAYKLQRSMFKTHKTITCFSNVLWNFKIWNIRLLSHTIGINPPNTQENLNLIYIELVSKSQIKNHKKLMSCNKSLKHMKIALCCLSLDMLWLQDHKVCVEDGNLKDSKWDTYFFLSLQVWHYRWHFKNIFLNDCESNMFFHFSFIKTIANHWWFVQQHIFYILDFKTNFLELVSRT